MSSGGAWTAAFKKALVYHWNLLFLGVAGGLAYLSGRPDVVLPLAGAAEIAYLALLSSNARFQNLAVALETYPGGAGGPAPPVNTMQTLSPADRARYQRLSDQVTRLRGLSAGPAGEETAGLPDLQLENIDRLLRLYLRLLVGKNTLERFFATVNEAELERDLARSRERLATLDREEGDPARIEQRRAILADTIATIETRQKNYRVVRENHDAIVLELERLNTKIAGIAEMGIERRDAASVGREIDLVTVSVEGTERTMLEIEGLAGMNYGAPGDAARTRRGRAGTRT